MSNYTLNEIYEWDINSLYNAIAQLEEEPYETKTVKFIFKDEYNKIEHGIKIEFHIHKILYNFIIEKPEFNSVVIKGVGKVNSTDFYTEVKEREKLMRKILIECYEDDSATKPRIK